MLVTPRIAAFDIDAPVKSVTAGSHRNT